MSGPLSRRNKRSTLPGSDLYPLDTHPLGASPGSLATGEDYLRLALAEIRRKVHAHNRGGGLSLSLRKEIRDIADAALALPAEGKEG